MKSFYDDDEDEPARANSEWLVTFADLCMLLLVFFILLFSMSSLDVQRFTSYTDSLHKAFGIISGKGELDSSRKNFQPGDMTQDGKSVTDMARMREEIVEAQKLLFSELRSFLNTKGLEGKISSVFDEGVITLSLPGNVLFKPGNENIEPGAEEILKILYDFFIKNRTQSINIKGHTDDSPMPPGVRFKDNWELSSLRAVAVLRYFLNKGIDAARMTATGMGAYEPLYPNDSEEDRARNNRVDIVMERRVMGK